MSPPPLRPLHKILVANRGEIACRIVRTARTLGYRTVAVYSEADAQAPHVALADEAIGIGPAPAAASYLNIPALLEAARRTGADAVHPGYGFLSERADFARACLEAALRFIGPSAQSIEAMGNKALAKRRMLEAGVPCAPGYLGILQDDATLLAQAVQVGFPLLVKAVAGGGGRGIRLARNADELPGALAGARREAQAAFGDGALMLEALIAPARHIEIQVFADTHGNVLHLGERDCTAQRRRQKVIEEAPSPFVDAPLRAAMGRDAVAAARAVGYLGAGTVEFLVDGARRHYFLEMNTRLQVEHPVTECVTGLDLVAWQLRVAAGEPLPLRQEEVPWDGHAIEARLYAEDPYAGFLPQTGRIGWWRPQRARQDGARIDDGIQEGSRVTPYYDAMVAKLIVHGRDRAEAIRRLVRALEDSPLLGLASNARFLRDLLRDPAFAEARLHTTLLDEWVEQGAALLQRPLPEAADWLIAAGLLMQPAHGGAAAARPAGVAGIDLTLECDGATRRLRATVQADHLLLTLEGATHRFELLGASEDGWLRIALDGVQRRIAALRGDQEGDDPGGAGALVLASAAAAFHFVEPSAYPRSERAADPLRARAPVAGVVGQVLVRPGDAVAAGAQLVCIEAMKMELWVLAGAAGRVRAVHAGVGAAVAAQAVVVELEAGADSEEPT
jgi:geranyl-CoA carboxylase alpha subunit